VADAEAKAKAAAEAAHAAADAEAKAKAAAEAAKAAAETNPDKCETNPDEPKTNSDEPETNPDEPKTNSDLGDYINPYTCGGAVLSTIGIAGVYYFCCTKVGPKILGNYKIEKSLYATNLYKMKLASEVKPRKTKEGNFVIIKILTSTKH